MATPLHRPRIAPEVADALAAGRPVVALESTLVAHGLPWPHNLETARAAEAAVRQAGAVPATIAAPGGVPTIGLDDAALEALARSDSYRKVGRRELADVMARRIDAATTVSATLHLARRAGIRVMATGGLGGVHRDVATSHDVSADLDELARADGCLVVCSGVKSILDVPATLERLETLGVAVAAYGTSRWPAFTTADSGLDVETRVDSPEEAAALVAAHRALGLPGAVVLARPVDAAVEVPQDEMEAALAAALQEARRRGVGGKAITPFLLGAIREATAGRSLAANVTLIVANAALAGRVAAALRRP
jgi:pseudouridine-5'-phosphate glycosidase